MWFLLLFNMKYVKFLKDYILIRPKRVKGMHNCTFVENMLIYPTFSFSYRFQINLFSRHACMSTYISDEHCPKVYILGWLIVSNG